MIGKFLRELSVGYMSKDIKDGELSSYMDLRNHPGWKVHQAFLLYLIQAIGNDMLSKEYTKLSAEEKDIRQRAYQSTYEVIKFLLNPIERGQQQQKIAKHNKKMRETTERK